MQVKPNARIDPHSQRVIGTTEKIDIEYVKANPKPTSSFVKNSLITSCGSGIVTDLDNKIFLPTSIVYETSSKSVFQIKLYNVLKRIFHLQVCDGCLEKLTTLGDVVQNTIDSTRTLCDTTCNECERLNDSICDKCTEQGLRYPVNNDPLLGPCKNCLGKRKCV